jgi:Protein of unknown function (DUF3617)
MDMRATGGDDAIIAHESRRDIMTGSISGTAVALFLLTSAAPAYAIEPEAGQWKATIKTQVSGRPSQEISHERCVTPEMIKDPESTFTRSDANAQRDCKRSFNKGDSTLSWTIECTGKMMMSGSGSMTFDSPTHYSGSFKVFGNAGDQPFEIETQMEGERIGDCAK